MADQPNQAVIDRVMDSVRGGRDAASVRRVFGDSYALDGVTIIPVAQVAGAGGGGGGTDSESDDSGFGSGYALRATPVGVYEVRGSDVTWRPAMDASQLARRGQVLVGIIAVCVTLVLVLRRR